MLPCHVGGINSLFIFIYFYAERHWCFPVMWEALFLCLYLFIFMLRSTGASLSCGRHYFFVYIYLFLC